MTDHAPHPEFVAACHAYAADDRKQGDRHLANALAFYDDTIRRVIAGRIDDHFARDDVYTDARMSLWRHCTAHPDDPPGEGLVVRIAQLRAIDYARKDTLLASNRHDLGSTDHLDWAPEATEQPEPLEIPPGTPTVWVPFLYLMSTGHGDEEIGVKLGMTRSAGRRIAAGIRGHYRGGTTPPVASTVPGYAIRYVAMRETHPDLMDEVEHGRLTLPEASSMTSLDQHARRRIMTSVNSDTLTPSEAIVAEGGEEPANNRDRHIDEVKTLLKASVGIFQSAVPNYAQTMVLVERAERIARKL